MLNDSKTLKKSGNLSQPIIIDCVERSDKGVPHNAQDIEDQTDWQWVLGRVAVEISFRSTGSTSTFDGNLY